MNVVNSTTPTTFVLNNALALGDFRYYTSYKSVVCVFVAGGGGLRAPSRLDVEGCVFPTINSKLSERRCIV